jgi:L-seryl-tRNA(Ser) seleniumtransferase
MVAATPDPRRRLPSVDRVLGDPSMARLVGLFGRAAVTATVRCELERQRATMPGTVEEDPGDAAAIAVRVGAELTRRLGEPPRRVLNATGVFLHTNLGRAPLPRAVAAALPALLSDSNDLEFDLLGGVRGDRSRRTAALLMALTGAEAALAVNNNAAALVLALQTHADGREVVVARGELVEIGGGFRIPEILAAAGARLREVGTTNRTRLADYAAAIGPETAVLLKVHPSNYRVSGFTAEVGIPALADLGRRHGLPVFFDEGSGLLRRHAAPQLRDHLSLAAALAEVADLVCGSGDKLLGGPQAGLLLGRAALVGACARHPLYRALRPGRAVLAILELVLRGHLAGEEMPLDALWPDVAAHRRRLDAVAAALGAEIVGADAYVGGGAAPEAPIPGEALALPATADLAGRLRSGDPAVVGYVRDGKLILDLRTVDPGADAELIASVRSAGSGNRD